MTKNTLYYGDNLDVLRRHINDESIDLVYLDPPFKSSQDYNLLFAEQDGSKSRAQIKAFEDTWSWDREAAIQYDELVEDGGQLSITMQAFRKMLSTNDVLAYLTMMAPRIVELHRVLKRTGSLYLHCDPTASHYLKLLLDAVFTPQCFRNEIIWHYKKWPAGKFTYQRNHDVIFFYTRTADNKHTFNQQFMDRALSTLKRFGTAKIVSAHDEDGNRLPSQIEDADSEGVRMDDVWDISRVAPIKVLFPTQKPEALLSRFILGSSNEDDVVLDPFCGCGTTIVSAQALKRKWIGIDITHLATGLIKHRLMIDYKLREGEDYEVIGEPEDLTGAGQLAKEDPYQFQGWIIGKVGARLYGTPIKKGADKGIDGRLYFHDDSLHEQTKQIMLSVKGGNLKATDLRDLRGVVDREGASIGVLLCLNKPTRPMKAEASSAGFYKSPLGTKHPKLQILCVEELLAGSRIDYPKDSNVTSRRTRTAKQQRLDPNTGRLFEKD